MTNTDRDDDQPLDPAAERLMKTMRRLVVISGAIMGIGFAVVLGVIGYRISRGGESIRPAAAVLVEAPLPAGGRVVGTTIAEGRLAVTIETPEGAHIRLYDATSLRHIGEIALKRRP